jgi:hypothetical protein
VQRLRGGWGWLACEGGGGEELSEAGGRGRRNGRNKVRFPSLVFQNAGLVPRANSRRVDRDRGTSAMHTLSDRPRGQTARQAAAHQPVLVWLGEARVEVSGRERVLLVLYAPMGRVDRHDTPRYKQRELTAARRACPRGRARATLALLLLSRHAQGAGFCVCARGLEKSRRVVRARARRLDDEGSRCRKEMLTLALRFTQVDAPRATCLVLARARARAASRCAATPHRSRGLHAVPPPPPLGSLSTLHTTPSRC